MRAGVETMWMGWKRGIACANETTCLASQQPVTVLAEQRVECYGSSFVFTLLPRTWLSKWNGMSPSPCSFFAVKFCSDLRFLFHFCKTHHYLPPYFRRCCSTMHISKFYTLKKRKLYKFDQIFQFFHVTWFRCRCKLIQHKFHPYNILNQWNSFIVFHNNSIGIKCLSIFWRKCSTKLTIIGKYFEYLQFSGFYLLCFKMNGRIKCLRIQK